MTHSDFREITQYLSARWKQVEEDWWMDEAWDFCEHIPFLAFRDWAKHEIANGRQYPLPGEFKRYWWDNRSKYEPKNPECDHKSQVGCEYCDCKSGYIWAWKDNCEYVFRCPHCHGKCHFAVPAYDPFKKHGNYVRDSKQFPKNYDEVGVKFLKEIYGENWKDVFLRVAKTNPLLRDPNYGGADSEQPDDHID